MMHRLRRLISLCCLFSAVIPAPLPAIAEDAPRERTIRHPLPYQVIQREGFVPQFSHAHHPGGPVLGFADVVIDADWPDLDDGIRECRVVGYEDNAALVRDWQPLRSGSVADRSVWRARIPAGGWYRLEFRVRVGDESNWATFVEPVGVGEVFLIAGQSYASNSNDERLNVDDLHGRVAVFDEVRREWRIAHDPQPTGDTSDSGSIWPAFGDQLLPRLGVPIGLANVAVGATSSEQWLPEGELHARLRRVGLSLGRFRAVLWQQGESDVIAKTSTEQYVRNLLEIRNAAVAAWGFSPPWYAAKSTLHPTVYNDPAGEGRIRQAIDQLWQSEGFRPGPDTDLLDGENRGGPMTRRHFSPIGQRRAAAMWVSSIWNDLGRSRPAHEAVLAQLPELHLLEPCWRSTRVHRESSVLLREGENGPPTARLAFPAAEILAVRSADGRREFRPGTEVSLSEDRLRLRFMPEQTFASISSSELFPPEGAPNSYRSRIGHPDQNLLYQPGRWFHDRNVEITYERAPAEWRGTPPRFAGEALPQTLARLRAGESLTLGISGDSISTGLDASAITCAEPFQFGYPELVAAQLQSTYGTEIELQNRSVAGWSIVHGLQDLERMLETQPQLLVVAYGMNDVGRRDPAWFGTQVRTLIERARGANPGIEILLVATMLGNEE